MAPLRTPRGTNAQTLVCRRNLVHALLATSTASLMDAAIAATGPPVVRHDGTGTGAERVAKSLARDERLLTKGVLPIFPLVTERRDIDALLSDEASFRATILSSDADVYQRCTAASCQNRMFDRGATWFSVTLAGTPRADPAPPLTLGSLSMAYFEKLASASSDPAAVMAAAAEYSVAARDANELAIFAQKSARGGTSRGAATTPQTNEYLDRTVAATRRCAASLAQIVSYLPPPPSQSEMQRIYELVNEELVAVGR